MNFLTVKNISIAVCCAALIGCASKPIVDLKGLDEEQYQQDLKECEAVADQVDTGESTVKGAAFGALVGGAIGIITGNPGRGLATGGVAGGASGANKGDNERGQVIKNCLKNRGYAILN